MIRGQRKRTKGWRKPPNSRYVGRGTKWGNPYRVIQLTDQFYQVKADDGGRYDFLTKKEAAQCAADLFREYAVKQLAADPHWLDDLRQYDELQCFCGLDMPCHVDILIELMENNNGKDA